MQLSYDGTFEGLLTVVFEIYSRKISPVTIVKQKEAASLSFAGDLIIPSDPEKAGRVWAGLQSRLSAAAVKNVYWCFLSGISGMENTLLEFCRLVFSTQKNVEDNYGNAVVMQVAQTAKKVGREKHRFEAFVRFEKIGPQFFYAPVEPDYNILPIILPHFKSRYADQDWVIYDTRRHYGMHYDWRSGEVQEAFIAPDETGHTTGAPVVYDGEERKYQGLWKNYFKNAGIPARRNMKLHLKHIPKRYWKYMVEKK